VARDVGTLKIHQLQRVHNDNYYYVWQIFVNPTGRSAKSLKHYSRRMLYEEIFSAQVCELYRNLVIPRMHIHSAVLQRCLGRSQLQLGAYQHWNMHLLAQGHSTNGTANLLSLSFPLPDLVIYPVFQELHSLAFVRELAWGTILKLRYGILVLVKHVYYHLRGTVLSDHLS
jgi:hypothetical protein